MNYFSKHFNGELSLAKSFWINTMLVTIVNSQIILKPILAGGYVLAFLVYFPFATLLLWWGAIGTWYSATNYRKIHNIENKSEIISAPTLAQVMCFLWLTLSISGINDYLKVLDIYLSK